MYVCLSILLVSLSVDILSSSQISSQFGDLGLKDIWESSPQQSSPLHSIWSSPTLPHPSAPSKVIIRWHLSIYLSIYLSICPPSDTALS